MYEKNQEAAEQITLWIDEEHRILSFHPQPDFEKRSFGTHEEMLRYAVELAMNGYEAM